jgi:hypothetical protein
VPAEPVHQPAEYIPTNLIRTEPIGAVRVRQEIRRICPDGIAQGKDRCRKGAEDDDQRNDNANLSGGLLQKCNRHFDGSRAPAPEQLSR